LKLLSTFFGKASREISCKKKYKKSTRGVHFTILPASPCAAEFYETWHTRSSHRRNHVCQIFSRSLQGLRSSDTPKIVISHWLAASPLQLCSTAVRHCDKSTLLMHMAKTVWQMCFAVCTRLNCCVDTCLANDAVFMHWYCNDTTTQCYV